MKKSLICLGLAVGLMTSGCSEWLQVYPQNDQVSDYLWTSQEDVEGVVNSSYYYFRNLVEPYLIPFGEFRGGSLYSRFAGNLQMFRVKSTDKAYANWGPFYQIINISNIVLANADKVLKVDKTYDENMMKAHKAEALYMRALCYFYLVRNWRDVPLVLDPYENDNATFKVKQSKEADVIAQIRKDLNTAIDSKAAKAFYDTNWETKGRATLWSMYALMADVCLWSGDYAAAETYCDKILNPASSLSANAPRFLSTKTRESWFTIFNPGNSNESIFEVQWDAQKQQTNTLTQNFNWSVLDVYRYTPQMAKDFVAEFNITQKKGDEAVRTNYGGCFMNALDGTSTDAWCWKYIGSVTTNEVRATDSYDAHYIIYRVADVMLMKAEALVMQGQSHYQGAIDLINQIRERSKLTLRTDLDPSKSTELEMLQAVLYERQMELAGEGKIWYDILRMGRAQNRKYWETLLVSHVLEYKYNSSSDSWVRGVFANGDDAMFMPVWEQELEYNDLLVQNPYYK